ncbi:sulfurtransferase complex subunit TusD [Marinomonas agarivorans]|nr:sulfurtransferase complex subunit TusD [Marinomonas agarivorans]
MRYALLIKGSPFSSRACHSALTFAQAIIANSKHQLLGVFFYQDSVLIGNKLNQVARDEFNIQTAWQVFGQTNNIPLSLCIAAAVGRGVINETESQRYEETVATLADGFTLEGLGSLVALMNDSDKLITFN